MKILIILIAILFSFVAYGQEDNPDRYTSITLGTGITGTQQTFLTDRYPNHEWKRFVNVPNIFAKVIIPASDYLSVILDYNYSFKTNSYFDYRSPITAPKNIIMQTYYISASLKFYLKDK